MDFSQTELKKSIRYLTVGLIFLCFVVPQVQAVTVIKSTSFENTQGNDPIGYSIQDANVVGSISRTTNNPRTGSTSIEFNDVENSGTVAMNPVNVEGYAKTSVEVWFEPDNNAWTSGDNIRVWAIVDTNTQIPGIPDGPNHPVGGFQGTDDGNALDDAGNRYRRFGFTLPDTATQVELFVQLVGGNANQAWIDDVSVYGYNDTNIINSTSFENTQGNDPIGYSIQDANVVGSISRTTTNPRTGSTSIEFNDVENSGTVAMDPVDVSSADSIGVELWFEPDNNAWVSGDNIRAWILADTDTQIPGIPDGPNHPVGGFAGTDDGNALDDAGNIYRRFSFVAPDTASQVELFVQLVGGNANQAWLDDVTFINLTEPSGGASVTISSPGDPHDTNVSTIAVSGSGNNADAGDSVVVSNSLGVRDTVAIQADADSSWTAASVELADGADSVVASLKSSGPTSSTTAEDTITVTLDQDSPDSSVTGVALNDTGHFAFESTWDTFASTPDTVSGFSQWVIFYKKGTGVTSSDSRWDAGDDGDLTGFLTGDSTIITNGLDDDKQFSFAVSYEDEATNLGPLSSEFTFTSRKQTLVINELNINPASEDNGEWFELFNASSDTVLIDGYQLKTGAGNVWTIPSNNWTISPGKSVVLGNDAAEFRNVYGYLPNFAANKTSSNSSDTDLGSGMGGLGNSSDTAAIFKEDGTLLDSMKWGTPSNAKNDFALSSIAGNGTPSNLRKTEGDEGKINADRPELGEFTERLDQTFADSTTGTFDSEGPDTDGLEISTADIIITDPSNGTDTTASVITVSGTTADADAGDTVSILVDGILKDTTTVNADADSGWTATSVEIGSGDNTVKARLHSTDVNSTVRISTSITVTQFDQLATMRISEMTPIGGFDGDWVELVVVDSGAVAQGWQLVDHDGDAAQLGGIDTTVKQGDSIVIHNSTGTSDTDTKSGGSGPAHSNTAWDIYTGGGFAQPSTTDNSLMIREGGRGSSIQDFMAYSNGDESVAADVRDDLDTAVNNNEWTFSESGVKREFDLVALWPGSPTGDTVIYRGDEGTDGDTKYDWDVLANPTKGSVNSSGGFNKDVGSGTAFPDLTILKGGDSETIRFIYTAKADFSKDTAPHGRVTMQIPAIWPAPTLTDGSAEGFVNIKDAGSDGTGLGADTFTYTNAAGDSVVVLELVDAMSTGETVAIIYGDRSRGGAGVTVPNTTGFDTFWIRSDPTGNNVQKITGSEQPVIHRESPETITLDPNTDPNGNPGDTTLVTATVKDGDGDRLQGAFVDFSIASDPVSGGSPTWFDTTPADGKTDEKGEVTVIFKTDSKAAGENQLFATVDTVTGGDTFTQTTTSAGSGKASISPDVAQLGEADTFTMSYTADLALNGGTVSMMVPANWTIPTTTGSPGDAGYVEASSSDGTVNVDRIDSLNNEDTVVISVDSLSSGGVLNLTYYNATSTGSPRTDKFTVQSAGSGETRQPIANSPTVDVKDYGIVINEVNPAPTNDWNGDGNAGGNDEFIEIYNFTGGSQDISGWAVDDEEGANAPDSFPASGVTIPANGYVVAWQTENFFVFDSSGDSINSGSLQASESWSSLNNSSADTARVIDSGGVVVDVIAYLGAHEQIDSDSSIERQIDNWSSYIRDNSTNNFQGSPTPGIAYDQTGDTPGPANGSIRFTLPDTTVSSRDLQFTVWVENANGDTVTDFNNAIELGGQPGSISPLNVNTTNGSFSGSMRITTADSTSVTVSGTYVVTTRGTDTINVFQPVIDTPTLRVTDGADTLKRPDLQNDTRLADERDHTVTVQLLHLDPSADTVSIYYNQVGQSPTLTDKGIALTHDNGDTWSGLLASASDHAPGDSISFLVHTQVSGGETVQADSGGTGFQYRVDPRVDSGTIEVTDGSTTLSLAALDGLGQLQDQTDHTVDVQISGADTAYIFDTATTSGGDPVGITATTSDTRHYGTNTAADTWRFRIQDGDFVEGDTVNFIISARLISSGTTLNDTVTEDSGTRGFAYEVTGSANTTPSVSVIFPDTGAYVGGDVPGTFVVTDAEDVNGTATVEFDTGSAGGDWKTATLNNGDTTVTMTVDGDTNNFTWDSLADVGSIEDTPVRIRIKVYDGTDTGDYDTSAEFIVDNRAPPKVTDFGATTAIAPEPDTGVFLSWKQSDTDVEKFNVYRIKGTADTSRASVWATRSWRSDTISYHDTAVTQGDSYFYYVTTVDTAGNESDSSIETTGPYVSISKTDNADSEHRPGDTIVYTISFHNEGFGPADRIRVFDAIPDSTTVSDSAVVIDTPAGISDIQIEYKVSGSWQTSSFPRGSITQIRWVIPSPSASNEQIDPSDPSLDFSGRLKFFVRVD